MVIGREGVHQAHGNAPTNATTTASTKTRSIHDGRGGDTFTQGNLLPAQRCRVLVMHHGRWWSDRGGRCRRSTAATPSTIHADTSVEADTIAVMVATTTTTARATPPVMMMIESAQSGRIVRGWVRVGHARQVAMRVGERQLLAQMMVHGCVVQ